MSTACCKRRPAGNARPTTFRTALPPVCGWLVSLPLTLLAVSPTWADDLEACRELLIRGEYEECAEAADRAIVDGRRDEAWWLIKARALQAVGKYREAQSLVGEALSSHAHYHSLRLRVLAYELHRYDDRPDRAKNFLYQADALVGRTPWRYQDPPDLVALGRMALYFGADARQVLEVFFDRAREKNPECRDVYLAVGALALDKHDAALAAETFEAGLQAFPDDPDMHYGLARAFSTSDRRRAARHLEAALARNPNHLPALLLQVDQHIDAEQYEEAGDLLTRILGINPAHPQAWAYRAVLAHLRTDDAKEQACREHALRAWPKNPEVNHLIGRKLSQKYRFAEGADYQRRALALDSSFLPARIQLSQDLLRLGEEDEGWRLAREVNKRDGYDVTAYNLVTLHDTMASFRTLRDGSFVLRMNAREAEIYGQRVLELLRRAQRVLCDKYGLTLDEPVTVELFHEQKDFAVRTFGMPGGEGFLGVCFGSVITANSPAALTANPTNWQAVLWHEFCHVVTLNLTRNKMPRWLSEGISVYEERQADPTWGQSMTPRYREMILDGGLTPIGRLSAAFLAPPSPLHLQFAYFESSLVVEFLIERYGLDRLKEVLHALSEGEPIDDALSRHVGPLEVLEEQFAAYARKRAESLAPDADWAQPHFLEAEAVDPTTLADWVREHPRNVPGLMAYAQHLIGQQKWNEAKQPLRTLINLFPGFVEDGGPYFRLATVHRQLQESKQEREVLEALAARDADALEAYRRLVELATAEEDWPAVIRHAEQALAVSPLIAEPYRAMAPALEALGRNREAIQAYRTWLLLEPADPAAVHFRLARLLDQAGDPAARRHVLMALEEAPRFRDAQRLLLKIHRRAPASPDETAEPGAMKSVVEPDDQAVDQETTP